MKRVPVPETRDADGFATSLSTNRHDSPLPPAVSNYYKVIRTSWGRRVLAGGGGRINICDGDARICRRGTFGELAN